MATRPADSEELVIRPREEESVHNDLAESIAAREKTVSKPWSLWNERRFLFRLTSAGLVLSTLIAFVIPKKFQSTARLMPPDQSSLSTGLAAMLAMSTGRAGSALGGAAGNLLGLRSSGELFVEILQSRTVQDHIISQFDLRKIYGVKLWKNTRRRLTNNTQITEDRATSLITIQVTDKDPQRAAAIGSEYVEELNRVVNQLNTTSAHRERVFLEERLTQVKQDLESAEKGFSEFASKNAAIDIQVQGKAMIEGAATLEGEMIAAQTELEGLKQIYAEGNVRVRATQARIEELRRQLQKINGQPDTTGPKSENDQSMYPSIRSLPVLGVNYADLYRNTKVEETVFEVLTEQYELAKVEEAKETPSIKVLDPPNIPERKSSPHRLLMMIFGSVFAFLFGSIWVLSGAHWREIGPQEPGKVLALEVIETVRTRLPHFSSNGSSAGKAR